MQLTSFLSSKLLFFSLGSIARTLCSLELFYFALLHFMFLVSFFHVFFVAFFLEFLFSFVLHLVSQLLTLIFIE